jgi:formylglycine-generating enzyme required for sulfatase activity
MLDTNRKLNVFICYAKEDKPKVRDMAQWLVAGGWIKVWLDEFDLLPGQDWESEIEKAAERADVVLVCLSNRSVVKESYFQKEVRFILELAKLKPADVIFAIPVRLEECTVPKSLSRWQWVDVFSKEGHSRLMRSLIERANGIGLPTSSPAKTQSREKVNRSKLLALGGIFLLLTMLVTIVFTFSNLTTVQSTPTPVRILASDTPASSETASPVTPPTSTSTTDPGNTWYSPKDGMTMLRIPSGGFDMGSGSGSGNQKPVHEVTLSQFWMDKTEVTNAMFQLFVQTTGYKTDAEKKGCSNILKKSDWECVKGTAWNHPFGPGSSISTSAGYPVIHVSWNDATAYCNWRGYGSRLPTEAEWEKAARGTDGRLYPWGDKNPTVELLNFNNDLGIPVRVGSYPKGASPYGLLDMAGNVSEWVADWYSTTYYAVSPNLNPPGPDFGQSRVTRGGSWNFNEFNIRTTYRREYLPASSNDLVGFRCARSE